MRGHDLDTYRLLVFEPCCRLDHPPEHLLGPSSGLFGTDGLDGLGRLDGFAGLDGRQALLVRRDLLQHSLEPLVLNTL